MRQRKHKSRREVTVPVSPAGRRGARAYYWAMGGLAVAGAAMLAAALAPRRPAPAVAGTTPAGQLATGNPAFPAQYDSLGLTFGPEDAPVVLREFVDYQCPACRQLSATMQRLRDEFSGSGAVRFVIFDLPITTAHPNALAAAQAARCAARLGGYWAMHDALFEHQPDWAPLPDPTGAFTGYARDAGLDGRALRECLASGIMLPAIRSSAQFAAAIGVRSTPTVVLGDVPLSGVRPYAELRAAIDAQLAGQSSASGAPSAPLTP